MNIRYYYNQIATATEIHKLLLFICIAIAQTNVAVICKYVITVYIHSPLSFTFG